jgi:hypothetical protein
MQLVNREQQLKKRLAGEAVSGGIVSPCEMAPGTPFPPWPTVREGD